MRNKNIQVYVSRLTISCIFWNFIYLFFIFFTKSATKNKHFILKAKL